MREESGEAFCWEAAAGWRRRGAKERWRGRDGRQDGFGGRLAQGMLLYLTTSCQEFTGRPFESPVENF